MANIKSAKKRIKTIAKRTLRNKMIKSRTKTEIKKVFAATAGDDMNVTKTALSRAVSAIDRAAKKGVLHKNTAARKKSKLAKMVNKATV